MNKLWIVVPFVMFYLSMFLISLIPYFLIATATIGLLVYGAAYYLKPYVPGESQSNTIFVGMITASYSFSALIYFTKIIQVTNAHFMETLIFLILNTIWVPLFGYMLRSDPGTVRSNGNNEWAEVMKALERDESIPNYCFTCDGRRPLRYFHIDRSSNQY